MLGRKSALVSVAALLCGVFAMPAPIAAQCRLCDVPETQRDGEGTASAVKLEVQAALDFDRLILLQAGGSGTARINPDGSYSTTGALGSLSGRAMVGSVVIRGEPGKAVQVVLPGAILLHGLRGGTIRLESIASDLGGNPRLDSRGELRIRFGGELTIVGDAEGDYQGDIPLTVEYL
jgi:hypothetical protein